jgi:hypothetical protein
MIDFPRSDRVHRIEGTPQQAIVIILIRRIVIFITPDGNIGAFAFEQDHVGFQAAVFDHCRQ